jgi:hypothetical protein
VGKDGKRETLINDVYKKSMGQTTPLVTVINADSEQAGSPVLPTSGKSFRPNQLKSSAAGEKIRPHT